MENNLAAGRMLFAVLFLVLCGVSPAAEPDGFSILFHRNGLPGKIFRHGKILFTSISLEGSLASKSPSGNKIKAEEVFVEQERSGNVRISRIRGVLKSGSGQSLADFQTVIRESSNGIRFETSIKSKAELQSHSYPFYWLFKIPEDRMRGRGVRCESAAGLRYERLLPERFETRIKLAGSLICLAFPEEVLCAASERNGSVRLEDNRNWDKRSFHLMLPPKALWSNAAQTLPAGSEFNWSFTLAPYVPEEEGE